MASAIYRLEFGNKKVYVANKSSFARAKLDLSEMYTPTLLHTYRSSKSRLPITTWISAVAKNLPQFRDDASIFNAVPVNIKIAGSAAQSNGNVSVSVAAFEPNWYQSLVASIAKMTNQPAERLSIVNYLGDSISSFTSAQLACIGECDIIDTVTKKPLRLPAVVAPPLNLATNKTTQLSEWWSSTREDLARQIATSFKGLSMAELANQTIDGGSTHQLIRSYLSGNTLHNLSWDAFASTYGKSATASVDDIAASVLNGVKQALVSNQTQVRNFHAISGEATLWKRGTGAPAQTKDEFTMYRDIVEDAMFHPMIGKAVIDSIMYGVVKKGQSKPRTQLSYQQQSSPMPQQQQQRILEESDDEEERLPPKDKEEEWNDDLDELAHPVTAYYQRFHQPVHGKVPYHHIEALNKGYGRVEAKYPGDAKKVMELFNLYSGRSVIGCDACSVKRKKKSKQRREEAEEPVERKLVPISAAVGSPKRLIPIDSVGFSLPPLVRLDNGRTLPPLIPIGSNTATPKMPPLIQMGVGDFAEDYVPTLDDFM